MVSRIYFTARNILQRITYPAHAFVRERVSWYEQWHRHPHHRNVHLSTAALSLLVTVALIAQSFTFPQAVKAIDNEVTLTGTNTNLMGDDANVGPIALGFSFTHFGTTYTTAYININGTVNFGGGNSTYNNGVIPGAMTNAVLAFWDDLITQSGKKTIYYRTEGETIGSRKFIVQWTNMYFYSNPTLPMGTFQAILYEGSNEIQIQYRDLLGGNASLGDSATIGIAGNSSTAYQYSRNTASLTQEQAIRYTPTGSSTYSINTAATYDPVYLVPSDVPASPTLINPPNATTGSTLTPAFEWQSVPLATSYRLLVSTVSNFSSTVVNQSGITDTFYTLGSSLSTSTQYYWRVEAINTNGSSFSSTRTFTTAALANADPDVPASVGPSIWTSGGSVTASQLSSIPLVTTLSDSDTGQQLRYRVQISTNSSFTGLVIDYRGAFAAAGVQNFTLGQTGGSYLVGTSSTSLTQGTPYYLRLRAEDDASASSSWYSVSGIAFTVVAAATPTPSPSPTPVPTASPTPEPTPEPTATPVVEATPTPEPTASPTPVPTASPTPVPTKKPTPTATVAVTSSPSPTASPTPEPTPEPTATPIPTPAPTATPATQYPNTEISAPPLTRTVTINVYHSDGTPIAYARVTLHSTPRTAFTNERGLATFTDVEEGDHVATVEYNGKVAEAPLSVASNIQHLDLNLYLEPKPTSSSSHRVAVIWLLTAGVVVCGAGIAGWWFFIAGKRRGKKRQK